MSTNILLCTRSVPSENYKKKTGKGREYPIEIKRESNY